MRIFKKALIGIVIFVGTVIISLYIFDVDYLLKAVRTIYFNGHTTAFLADYNYFDNRTIQKGIAQPWAISKHYNKITPGEKLEKLHKDVGTVAFLIIHNDSILSESYYDGYDKNSRSNSFSMAKSIVSAALGKAILQGKIKSLDQSAADFLPEFRHDKKLALITVGDLSSMASGLDWDESYYSPFSVTTRAYFDEDLASVVLGQKPAEAPGKAYKYLSGNTQLLAMVVEKATGQSLADYVSENFWQPMGAENDALWQTDKKDGTVKAYCCIASNARDFARFGKLYLNHGKWNGKQLLDSAFVATSIQPRFAASPEYGYGWWLANYKNRQIFYMRGHLGQYVIVIPQENLIITRLGHRVAGRKKENPHSDDFFAYVDEALLMKQQAASLR